MLLLVLSHTRYVVNIRDWSNLLHIFEIAGLKLVGCGQVVAMWNIRMPEIQKFGFVKQCFSSHVNEQTWSVEAKYRDHGEINDHIVTWFNAAYSLMCIAQHVKIKSKLFICYYILHVQFGTGWVGLGRLVLDPWNSSTVAGYLFFYSRPLTNSSRFSTADYSLRKHMLSWLYSLLAQPLRKQNSIYAWAYLSSPLFKTMSEYYYGRCLANTCHTGRILSYGFYKF